MTPCGPYLFSGNGLSILQLLVLITFFIQQYIFASLTLSTLQDLRVTFLYKDYLYTRTWSNERIKTKTTMLQENSNT